MSHSRDTCATDLLPRVGLTVALLVGGCATAPRSVDQGLVPVPEMVSWYLGACDGSGSSTACIQEVPAGWAMLSPGVPLPGPSRELWATTARRNLVVKRHETTQGEWRDLMNHNPSFFEDCGDDCPVERVSWWDVLEYLNRLSVRDGLEPCYELTACYGTLGGGCPDGRAWCEEAHGCEEVRYLGHQCPGYRLPTDDEWRWLVEALGSTGSGTRANRDGTIAWCADVSNGTTRSVRSPWTGLLPVDGVTGNVWEWVWDDDAAQETRYRTAQGGSFLTSPERCRADARSPGTSQLRSYFVGVRPVRSLLLATRPFQAPVIPPSLQNGELSLSDESLRP